MTTEQRIRELARKRAFDYVGTSKVAELAGCSSTTALRVLRKLAAEEFQTDEGATLIELENDSGNRPGPKTGGRARVEIIWTFT